MRCVPLRPGSDCLFDTHQLQTPGYPFVATQFNGGLITNGAIEWNMHGGPVVPQIDAGTTVSCLSGVGLINPTTGGCYIDASTLAGGQTPCANGPAYSGGDVTPGTGCTLNFAAGSTGSGAVALAHGPTFTTPTLGIATATTITSASYKTGASTGVTGSTCSHWTAGLCTSP